MYRYRVAVPLRLPHLSDSVLDYISPEVLPPGTPVQVSVRHHHTLGIIWSKEDSHSIESLKVIDAAWPAENLSSTECRFLERISHYYHQPLGCIASLAFPPDALRYFEKPPRTRLSIAHSNIQSPRTIPPPFELTPPQQRIIDHVSSLSGFQTHLIHGITGSGKTEIYRRLACQMLEKNLQTLWLVPEIKLTPQLFENLGPLWPGTQVTLHSLLTPAQRFTAWKQAKNGEADLIIGTRLAVFTPLPRLGLIIVDEEHDLSFSQQDIIRYHARDVAVLRAKHCNCPIVLGSATPSLESYVNATLRHSYHYHRLQQRAISGSQLPVLKLVPKPNHDAAYPWSTYLDQSIQNRLERREQSLIFLNRRGYAPALHCAGCGWLAECSHCSVRMVWHKEDRRIRCHHCGAQQSVPKTCPVCGHPDIFPMGLGTQKIEEVLKERFPHARLLRVDQDSMSKKRAWEHALELISSGEIDILIGTQMLAKGHHFPKLTLVGILGTDDALYSADFRASEHLFAQLIQVAGRAGRAKESGEVLLETHYPNHPLFQSLLQHDYVQAAQAWVEERKNHQLPPFSYCALLWAESKRNNELKEWMQSLYYQGQSIVETTPALMITRPMPALMEKRAGWYRYYCLIQSEQRPLLHHALNQIEHHLYAQPINRYIRWRIDVDPQSL